MRLTLTTIILTMLAQPVWAQTVYYCVMTSFAAIKDGRVEEYKPQRFKMAVTKDEAVFKNDGFLDDFSIAHKAYDPYDGSFVGIFQKNFVVISMIFQPPDIRFSIIDSNEVAVLHAECDTF